MLKSKFLIIILIIIIAAVVYFYFNSIRNKVQPISVNSFDECIKAGYPVLETYPRQCKTPKGDTLTEDIGNALEKQDLIRVTSPKPNEEIESPLTIQGEARGYWFFEASFPIQLYDTNNNLLGSAIAQAQSDWMTENFIPFTATLNFYNSSTQKGTLILRKDNPSDLPQNNDQLTIPIFFKATSSEGTIIPEATITVKAYFNNNSLDPEISCNRVFPVERIIPKTQAVARAALEELLKGPTGIEKAQNYFTSINPGVKIQSLTIENGTAKVDFDEQLEYQIGGSCKVSAIRAQITQTLMQFSTVKNVIISINGRTEDILQP